MTLAPVFRSERAVRMLAEAGVAEVLSSALRRQMAAAGRVRADLVNVVDAGFLDPSPTGTDPLRFLQEYFFLTLFGATFEALGVCEAHLDLYAELDFCIMGTITAADDLLDDESKSHLPLRAGPGSRFAAILELMCFERLTRRVGDRAARAGLLTSGRFEELQRDLLGAMGAIGRLEGSEEGGVDTIPPPQVMIEEVHRVRGGRLFGLAMIAPAAMESGEVLTRVAGAERALVDLGTAFQIVDDLTDFEVDLERRSHNLLVSWIVHRGLPIERDRLDAVRRDGASSSGIVEDAFSHSATQVLEQARILSRSAFERLSSLGLAFPAELADEVVHAIVGLEGVVRMEALTVEVAEGAA